MFLLLICKGVSYLVHGWNCLPIALCSYDVEGSSLWDPQLQPAHSVFKCSFYRLPFHPVMSRMPRIDSSAGLSPWSQGKIEQFF